jgi:hypothetical protein
LIYRSPREIRTDKDGVLHFQSFSDDAYSYDYCNCHPSLSDRQLKSIHAAGPGQDAILTIDSERLVDRSHTYFSALSNHFNVTPRMPVNARLLNYDETYTEESEDKRANEAEMETPDEIGHIAEANAEAMQAELAYQDANKALLAEQAAKEQVLVADNHLKALQEVEERELREKEEADMAEKAEILKQEKRSDPVPEDQTQR